MRAFVVIQVTRAGWNYYAVLAVNADAAIRAIDEIYGIAGAAYQVREFTNEPAIYIASVRTRREPS